jgi:hypothetical protein
MWNYLMTDVAARRQMEGFEKARIEQVSTDVAAVRQMERFETDRIERVTSEAKAQRRDDLATPSLGVRALGTKAARISRAAWWVPAGVAVLIMLYRILGG